jgi:DNA-directed RNA polymerase subunit RPC12/RpoP
MIDTVLNLLFRCPHRRLTRPVTPVDKHGVPNGETYMVCLECGRQFAYDLREMRIGKVIENALDSGVVPPNLPQSRKVKLNYALLAAVPIAAIVGAVLKPRKPADEKPRPGEDVDSKPADPQ